MDNNSRSKNFNVLDWVIVVALVLCVCVFLLRYYQRDEISGEAVTGKYELSFSVANVRYTTAEAFIKGDNVYVATDDTYIVVIEDVVSTPAVYYADDPSSGVKKVFYPEGTRVDITGTMLSDGFVNEDGFFAGGSYYLAPGKKITIYTGHIYLDIVLTDIAEYVE
ncbi:MAG: DUF4330 family protein [Clostridia bacterium]|nr:DUF4330 family protein [Clostridia bacterium]